MATIVRAFVIALTLTGATATVYTPTSLAATKPKPINLPVPMCPPSDPNACHIVINY